jgi:hypothetical protein
MNQDDTLAESRRELLLPGAQVIQEFLNGGGGLQSIRIPELQGEHTGFA